jgi:uncharacterized protein (TIGR03086 family)
MECSPEDARQRSCDDDAVGLSNGTRDVTALIEAGRDREAAEQGAAGRVTRDGGRMDAITQLELLGPHLGGVVAGISPGQLDNRTPCAHFTVRGVLQHMLGGAVATAAAYRGQQPRAPDLTDPLGSFGPVLGDLVDAISAPGALARTIRGPFGEVSGDAFGRFLVLDGLVHGWDLATATAQPYAPPEELVAEAFAFARETIDPLRDGDTFADAVEPAAGASPIERLANYTGRT